MGKKELLQVINKSFELEVKARCLQLGSGELSNREAMELVKFLVIVKFKKELGHDMDAPVALETKSKKVVKSDFEEKVEVLKKEFQKQCAQRDWLLEKRMEQLKTIDDLQL